jgi:hypothetical protein
MKFSKHYSFPCCHCGHEITQQIFKLKAGEELWCNACGKNLEYVPVNALNEIGRARRGFPVVRGHFLVLCLNAKLH